MGLQHQSKVVGGVDKPRFLIVGPELSPNISFEVDLTGWSGTATFLRVFDSGTPFGDYMMTVDDDSVTVQETVTCTIDAGEPVANLKFIVTFWVRNDASSGDQNFHVTFSQQSGGSASYDHIADQEWKQYTAEVIVDAATAGNNVLFDLKIGAVIEGVGATGKLRVDNFMVHKVFEDFDLPLPNRGNFSESWEEQLQAVNEKVNGSEKRYLKGFRYRYSASYERLTVFDEQNRRKLLAKRDKQIMFFPHKDAATNYFVRWDGEIESGWGYGVAPHGHEGNIDLISMDLIPASIDVIIDATNQHNPPAGPFFMGEGFYY